MPAENPNEQCTVVTGYNEYAARFWPIGPQYDLWGYDDGYGSGAASEGWHYIGQFDARFEPLPRGDYEPCRILTPRGKR